MDREDLEIDLCESYSKKALCTLADFLGVKQYDKQNKSELIINIVDSFYNKDSFNKLYTRLTPEAKIVVKHLTWNGISDLRSIDSLYNIKIALDDFYINTDDPFIKQFKNYYSQTIIFSNGLRFLFKLYIDIEQPNIHNMDEFDECTQYLSDGKVVDNLSAIYEFIETNGIKERGFNKKILIKTIKKFDSQFNINNSIKDYRIRFILTFISFLKENDNNLLRIKALFNSYKKGDLLEENIDQYLFYPFIKGITSNYNLKIFLKRGRYSFLNRIKNLNGWNNLDAIVNELSLIEETQIFDSSYFGSLLSVKVPEEYSREFSNLITLTYKQDNEDFLISPMCRGIVFFLYSIGAADIGVDDRGIKYNLSPFESLEYFRITPFGKELFGLKSTYKETEKEIFEYKFHTGKRIVTTIGSDPLVCNFLERIAESVGDNAFLVTWKSFFKECEADTDVEYNLKMLSELLGEEPPDIWKKFLFEVNDRVNPLYNEQELLVVNFPQDNQLFLNTIMNIPKIRELFFMVEGFKGAFSLKNYKTFKKLMKDEGYIV